MIDEDETIEQPASDVYNPDTSRQYNTTESIDPDLDRVMEALKMQESSGRPNVTSSAGAMGAYQIMPYMWSKYGKGDPYNEADSREAAIKIYQDEYIRFGKNRDLALAAYNAGSPAVIRALEAEGYTIKDAANVSFDKIAQHLKPETQKYVPSINTRMGGEKKNLIALSEEEDNPFQFKAGTAEELRTMLSPIIDSPEYNNADAVTALKQLKSVYDTKESWTPEAQELMKNVASAVWTVATPAELPDISEFAGSPPRLKDNSDKERKRLADWKAQTTKELRSQGLEPAFLGKRYDEYFEEAAKVEEAAVAYRNRGIVGSITHPAAEAGRAVARGAIGAITSSASSVPRLLGYEGAAGYIDKIPDSLVNEPSPDSIYEVDENGYTKLDMYGKPITKFQSHIANALGIMGMGATFLGGGALLKGLGLGAKAVAGAEMAGISTAISNSAYQDAIANGGTREQAVGAYFLSLPAGVVGGIGGLAVIGGAPTWVRGLSTLNKAKALAKIFTAKAAAGGLAGAGMQLTQDVGTSLALGQNVVSGEKIAETAIGMGLAGGLTGAINEPLKPNAVEHVRIAKELQEFADSKAKETKINLKSPIDADPSLLNVLGMSGEITPDGKLTVRKEHSWTPPDLESIPEEKLPEIITALEKDLSKEPEATFDSAHEIQASIKQTKEELDTTPPDAKEQVSGTRDLVKERELLNREVELLREGLKQAPETGKPDYEKSISDRLDRISAIDHFFEKNPNLYHAYELQTKLDDLYAQTRAMDNSTYSNDRQLKDQTLQAAKTLHAQYQTEKMAETAKSTEEQAKPPQRMYHVIEPTIPNIPYTPEFTEPENITQTSTKPVNPRKVVEAVENALTNFPSLLNKKELSDLPRYSLREGGRESMRKLVNKVAGYATKSSKSIFIKHVNQLPTLMHEFTHALTFDALNPFHMNPKVQLGLYRQAYTTYGSTDLLNRVGPEGVFHEGLSMFFEHYVTGQPVHKDVLNWYKNEFSKQYPKAYKAMEGFKEQVHGYIAMDPETRAKVFTGASKDKGKPPSYFLDNWVNNLQVLKDLDKAAGTRIADVAEAIKGSAREKAYELANIKMTYFDGQPIPNALPLKDYVNMAGKDVNLLSAYMLARYTIARHGIKGRPSRGQVTGFPLDQAKILVDKIESNPEFKHIEKAAQGLWEWNNHVLDIAASRSSLFAHIRNNIKQTNLLYTGTPHGYYIPFEREIEPIAQLARGTYKFGEADAIKRFQGDTRRIVNPLLVMQDHARMLLERANNNYLRDQIHALAKGGLSPISAFIREIPRMSQEKLKASVREVFESVAGELGLDSKELIKDALGIDITTKEKRRNLSDQDKDILESLVAFYRPEMTPPNPADGYVTMAYKGPDGKIEFYEEHPRLVQAFDNSLPDITRDPIVNALWIKPNVWFKMGATSFRMAYQLRNLVFRDFFTAYRRTDNLNPFALLRESLSSLVTEGVSGLSAGKWESGWSSLARSLGGQAATLHHVGRDLEAEITGSTGTKVFNFANKGFDYVENLLSVGERANRLAVMKLKARDLGITDPSQPLTPQQAIELVLAYKRSTTNFQIQGRKARVANLGVPFFTARIAEISQLPQDWQQHKGKFIGYALGYLGIGVYQALANNDKKWWQNLEPEEKATNFLTETGDLTSPIAGENKILRIPLETLAGAFHGVGVLIGESIMRQDLLKPSAYEQVKGFAKAYLPLSSPWDVAGVVGKEAIQQIANEDFFTKRDIVPKGLTEAPTASQYTPYTTELAKELGAQLDIAPSRIDHAFKGMFPAGLDFLRAIEVSTGIKPINEVPPGFGSLFSTAVTRYGYAQSAQDRSLNQFYQEVAKYQSRKDIETKSEGEIRKKLNRLRDNLSSINVVLSAEPDEALRIELYEKKQKYIDDALALVHGEKVSVGRTAEEGKAKRIREERRQERMLRLQEQEADSVSE